MTFKEAVYTAARLWASMTDDDKGNLHFCDIVSYVIRSKKKRKRHIRRAIRQERIAYPRHEQRVQPLPDIPNPDYFKGISTRYAFSECKGKVRRKHKTRQRHYNNFRGYRPEQPVMAV